jgi:hypothetical protein
MQHALLDLRGRLRIERNNRFGKLHGLQVGELATPQQVESGG